MRIFLATIFFVACGANLLGETRLLQDPVVSDVDRMNIDDIDLLWSVLAVNQEGRVNPESYLLPPSYHDEPNPKHSHDDKPDGHGKPPHDHEKPPHDGHGKPTHHDHKSTTTVITTFRPTPGPNKIYMYIDVCDKAGQAYETENFYVVFICGGEVAQYFIYYTSVAYFFYYLFIALTVLFLFFSCCSLCMACCRKKKQRQQTQIVVREHHHQMTAAPIAYHHEPPPQYIEKIALDV